MRNYNVLLRAGKTTAIFSAVAQDVQYQRQLLRACGGEKKTELNCATKHNMACLLPREWGVEGSLPTLIHKRAIHLL